MWTFFLELFKDRTYSKTLSGRDSTKISKLCPSKYIGRKRIWWGGGRVENGRRDESIFPCVCTQHKKEI